MRRVRELLQPASDWMVAQCSRLPRHTLAWTSIALALILLLSVNLFAGSALRNAKADLTQQRLFTISDGTRAMLRTVDEPISLRLYFSKRLGEAAPRLRRSKPATPSRSSLATFTRSPTRAASRWNS